MDDNTITATPFDAYELLTSRKMGATLYYDAQAQALVVSSNIPSAWHQHYTAIISRAAAVNFLGDDFQGAAEELTTTEYDMVAQWLNETILPSIDVPMQRA